MPIVVKSRLNLAATTTQEPVSRPDIQPRVRVRIVPVPANDETASVPASTQTTSDTRPGSPAADNDVGYGKPPKHSQFKPGQSGNPKGRPKGAKGLNTIVRKVMTKKVSIRIGGKTQRVSAVEALVNKTTEQAFSGNLRATSILLQRYDASVPDSATRSAPGMPQVDAYDIDEHDKAVLANLQAILRETEDE